MIIFNYIKEKNNVNTNIGLFYFNDRYNKTPIFIGVLLKFFIYILLQFLLLLKHEEHPAPMLSFHLRPDIREFHR